MPEKDDLDLLLDSALATYGDPGPDFGLEDRVLNALKAARVPEMRTAWADRKPRRGWFAWVFALPVAVCMLLLWLSTTKSVHAPSGPTQQARQTNQPPAIPRIAAPALAPQTSRRHSVRTARSARPLSNAEVAAAVPRPRLDVFPTPQPMSSEERALGVVAKQTPLPLRKALVEAQQDDSPIHIAAIHVPQLESPDQGQP
jgi:hypothetical protein